MITRITNIDEIRNLILVPPAVPGGADQIYDLFAASGALLRGHFLLQSGLHSPYLFRFRQIGREQRFVSIASKLLVRMLTANGGDSRGAAVLCPETAGIFLGESVARQAGLAAPAVARVDMARRPVDHSLRAGDIVKDQPVIIVNDVVTTGSSLKTLVNLVARRNARPVAVLAFATLNHELLSRFLNSQNLIGAWLAETSWKIFSADQCPLCRNSNDELMPAAEFN